MFRSMRAHTSAVAFSCYLLIITIVLQAGSSSKTAVFAHESGGYRNEPTAAEDNSNWMKNLNGNHPISALSIPGTHDSGSYTFGGQSAETQRMNIAEQLKAGIRVFDMRLGNNHLCNELVCFSEQCLGPDLYVFHGIFCQFAKFKDHLDVMKNFLQDHPGEALFMRVKFENGPNSESFTSQVETEMDSYPGLFFNNTENVPILNLVRGKIVLLRNYGGSNRGLDYGGLTIQDQYNLATNFALPSKWTAVRNQFEESNNLGDPGIFVNYLSASGGGFPYFFASGHSSWETKASRLATGFTRGGGFLLDTCKKAGPVCIDEYPSVNCLGKICTVVFEGINIIAMDYINKYGIRRSGMVLADFPGPGLIRAIIDTNERFDPPPRFFAYVQELAYSDGTYTFDAAVSGRDAATVTFDWNFGDAIIIKNGGAVVNHTYIRSGGYTVAVIATTPSGESVRDSLSLNVPEDNILSGYHNAPYPVKDNSDWMNRIAGTFLISSLSIPGTHRSGGYNFVSKLRETQGMSIAVQLKAGIRAFDLRLGNNYVNCLGPDLYIFHFSLCQSVKFKDHLDTMKQFLRDHPREAIFMRVTLEIGPNSDSFQSQVETEMDSYPSLFFKGTQGNPILDIVRGKIVLLRNYAGSNRGIDYDTLKIQDMSILNSRSDLANKWRAAREHFWTTDGMEPAIFVNYLSASGGEGGYPYFFASGQAGSENFYRKVLTDFKRGSIDTCQADIRCIPEYPTSTSCFFGICSVEYEGVNIIATNHITNYVTQRAGMVLADFPGPGLIRAIINTNYKLEPPPKFLVDLETTLEANTEGTYTFRATATGRDSTTLMFDWSFGDSLTLKNGGAAVAHTYVTAGNYLVTVKAITQSGETTSDASYVFARIINVKSGYHNEPRAAEDNSDWMNQLAGAFPIDSLSIPGTHSSGAYNSAGELDQTQGMNITEQLKAGIRAFDMRLGKNDIDAAVHCLGPDLYIFHGPVCQMVKFKDHLDTMEKFLKDHPREALFMTVKFEIGPNLDTFQSQVETEMDSYPNLFFKSTQSNPILDFVRGKIVLLRNYAGSNRGINYDTLKIQDMSILNSRSDLANKWRAVREHFLTTDGMAPAIFVNYLSASGGEGVYPYFFASGNLNWDTFSPNLLTGFTRGVIDTCKLAGSRCIPEYPSISCFFGTCSVAYEGVNIIAMNHIMTNVMQRAGMVLADFPGPGLIRAIININSKLAVPAPTKELSRAPTKGPTKSPTDAPTSIPTAAPTTIPTAVPTSVPTAAPTTAPTSVPTATPTTAPTAAPMSVPTAAPTTAPTAAPTSVPTAAPTNPPTDSPSLSPSFRPFKTPVNVPVTVPVPITIAPPVPVAPSSDSTQTEAPVNPPKLPVTQSPVVATAPSSDTTPTEAPVNPPTSPVTKSPVVVTAPSSDTTPTEAPVKPPTPSVTKSPVVVTPPSPVALDPTEAPFEKRAGFFRRLFQALFGWLFN